MLLGIGVDSIEISRVVKAMEKEHFVHRIFTEKERAEMEHTKRRGASDFAGKEAVVKAFGTGFAGIDACEEEILRRESGAPYVTLYGAARKKAEEMGITDWKISITNTKEVATASVTAVADDVKEQKEGTFMKEMYSGEQAKAIDTHAIDTMGMPSLV